MSDWGAAFDDQCRAEGLEVPEKTEATKSSPPMDQNEENRGGFRSGGVGRGGVFGASKTSAPPPQTSFGAVSGPRMGGAFGSTGGVDGRGAPIGSSGEDGVEGNVISVGIHKERSAFTRGGGFGTNRSMAPNPPATIKTNHEGGRFGTLAPRSLQGPLSPRPSEGLEDGKETAGGRFGVQPKADDQSRIGGSFGPAKSTISFSHSSYEGTFGSKSSHSIVPSSFSSATSLGFGNNSSMAPPSPSLTTTAGNSFEFNRPTNIGGSFGSANSTVGGSFGAKPVAFDPSAENRFGGGFSASSRSPASSIGASLGGNATSPQSEALAKTTASGVFGVPRVGGAFGSRTTSNKDSSDITTPLHSAKTELTSSPGFNSGGNFSNREPNEQPTAGGAFGKGLQATSSSSMGGSFGRKTDLPSKFGGGLTYEENKEARPFRGVPFFNEPTKVGGGTSFELHGARFASNEEPKQAGGFGGSDENSEPSPFEARSTPSVPPKDTYSRGGSFGRGIPSREEPIRDGGFGGNKENQSNEQPTIGGGFGLGKTSFGMGFVSKGETRQEKFVSSESQSKETIGGGFGSQREKKFGEQRDTTSLNGVPNQPNSSAPGFGFSSPRVVSEEKKFGQHRFELPKTEEKRVPFMPGQPAMRGGYQGGFRGGRGSGAVAAGGQMDFVGQGHSMGRGRGHPGQSSATQQSGPSYGGQQTVIPDSKYKYTKPVEEDHEKAPIPADIALLNKYIQKEVKMMKDTVVDIQRQDPTSPLYSISSFRELRLKPEVLQALDTLNFQFPTRIQETALPLLLMEPPSNLIAQAQSGTGKTAAFVLTMLCRIDVNLKVPQCICLAPTLELAKQIGEVVEKMGKYMENLEIHYAIKGGNMAAMRGRKLTEQIVIGTPGITRDYLQKYKCIDPATIRCLVLDEADVMIYHQGFTDISTTIYNMVEEKSDAVQSMLFSATYDQPVIDFATKIIKNAIVVMLKREEQALPNIKQFYVQCASRDSKYAAIVNLYSGLAVASSVIFCHTKASVMWLFENMKARGHQVDVLHGDMTVVERADTIIRFKRGDFKVLITTNVFARGIDVAQVSVVINYDLPIKYDDTGNPMIVKGFTQPDCETYLHRIGRTGRFGKTGIAINLIDSEDSMNMINILENHFQMKITRMDPSNLVELEAIEMA